MRVYNVAKLTDAHRIYTSRGLPTTATGRTGDTWTSQVFILDQKQTRLWLPTRARDRRPCDVRSSHEGIRLVTFATRRQTQIKTCAQTFLAGTARDSVNNIRRTQSVAYLVSWTNLTPVSVEVNMGPNPTVSAVHGACGI